MIQKILLSKYSELPIFLVTNVLNVKKINKKTALYNMEINKLPNNIMNTIEK
jgi:hypothetical protein